jgi:Fe-S oxidoreductase
VQITGLMIADLCYVRHGLEEMLGRGWREQVLAAEKCLTCDQREACRKSCPYGLDIGHVLGSFYQRIGPIVRERA